VSRATLSVGSNLGDRLAHLRGAVAGLAEVLVAASPVYETPAWGPVEQDDYLNAVLLVEGPEDPRGWLARACELEDAAGRERSVRWGPRTLDVDVITVDALRSDDPHLTLPHPRAHERAFVLVPWADVGPDAVLPGHGTVGDLAAPLRAGVKRRDDLVLVP
jgi:2-amino-4-hydroxy-6-hydroxymethyldihydropteridine diphosphokinase